MEPDKASEQAFAQKKDEDTITSSIPSRSGEPAEEPMPESAPKSNVAPYERAQVPTQRSDILRSDR